jgi:enolase
LPVAKRQHKKVVSIVTVAGGMQILTNPDEDIVNGGSHFLMLSIAFQEFMIIPVGYFIFLTELYVGTSFP